MPARYVVASLIIALMAIAAGAGLVAAPAPPAPPPAGSYVPGELIVRFKPQHRAAQAVIMSRLGAVAANDVGESGFVRIVLDPGDDVERALARYRSDPALELVQPNFRYQPQRLPNDPYFTQQWALKNSGQLVPQGSHPNNPGTAGNDMGLEAAWDLVTDCSNSVVAVVDTGINYTHLDLAANMWDGAAAGYPNHGYDFVNDDADPMPADGDGHGTHVAGIIAAVGDNARGIAGICWRARIMALRALNATGGTTDTVVRAIRFAVDHGARVINLSLGGAGYDAAFEAAIEQARQRDVIVVVAGGNGGVDTNFSPFYPCSFVPDNIVCVAALDQGYGLAGFSNYGDRSIDVAAPGTNTYGVWPGLSTIDEFYAGWQYSGAWRQTDCDFGDGLRRMLVNPGGACATSSYAAGADDRATKSFDLSALRGVPLRGAGLSGYYRLTTQDGSPPWPYTSSTDADALYVGANGEGGDPFASGATIAYIPDSKSGTTAEFALSLQNCLTANCKVGFRFVSDAVGASTGAALFQVGVHRAETNSNEYQTATGTSMATAHTSAVAALTRAYNPAYTYADVVGAVKFGGDLLPGLQSRTASGRAVDALGALSFINPPTGVTATIR